MADMTADSRGDYSDRDVTVVPAVLRRTSWGAVVAGSVIAIGLQLLMTVLGLALGFTTEQMVVDDAERVRAGVATGAATWWFVTGSLALLIGGCVVGRFAGLTRGPDVLLHGLTVWAVTAVFGFLVLSGAAGTLGTAGALYSAQRDGRSPAAMNMSRSTTAAGGTTDADQAGIGQTQPPLGDATAGTSGTAGDTRATADEVRRYVQAASWWSVISLLTGIAVTVGGAWMTAPERIIVRPPGARA